MNTETKQKHSVLAQYIAPSITVVDLAPYKEILNGGDIFIMSKGNVVDFIDAGDVMTGDFDDIIPE